MVGVTLTSARQVQEERGDIVWHSLPEVHATVSRLPDLYWKSVVSTLAFAGLRLSELAWLRTTDLDLEKGTIWVTTVEDATGDKHKIKSLHSRRTVNLHPKLLWPLLREYQRDLAPGPTVLFPVPEKMRRSRSRPDAAAERWRLDTLGKVLRRFLRTPQTGMMPLTLRHTFGSLLIRVGRNVTEVAAAMGNTPEVVLRHYARLLGHEVHINF